MIEELVRVINKGVECIVWNWAHVPDEISFTFVAHSCGAIDIGPYDDDPQEAMRMFNEGWK